MEKDYFLLKDRVNLIEASFLKDGWLTIYELGGGDHADQCLIFCCLVSSKRMVSYKEDRNWVMSLDVKESRQ